MIKKIIVAIAVFGFTALAIAQTPTAITADSGGIGANQNNGWNSIAVDASGNVFVAGTTSISGAESRIMIAKFTSTGTLVTTFGIGGIVIMASLSGGHLDQGNGIAVDSSDNVYIVGTADAGDTTHTSATGPDIIVAKFSSAGILDATWTGAANSSGQGKGAGIDSFDSVDIVGIAGDGNADDFGLSIALTASTAKVVVVGRSNGPVDGGAGTAGGTGGALSDIVVLQLLNTNGALDTVGFNATPLGLNGAVAGGKKGSLLLNASHQAAGAETATDFGMDVALDASGNIYALDNSSARGINVFKINPGGTLADAIRGFGNFDWDGDADGILTESVAIYPGNGPAFGSRITLDSNGNVYVVGADTTTGAIGGGGALQLLLLRFTSGGILDSTFGTGGVVTLNPAVQAEGHSIAIQSGGHIFVSGNSFNGLDMDSLVAEYNNAGALISANAGSVVVPIGSNGTSIYSTPAGADQGSKFLSTTIATTTTNPLVNIRTGVAVNNTKVYVAGGVDTLTATKADGLLLIYSGVTSSNSSNPSSGLTVGSSGGAGGGCGALGLDGIALIGFAYLLRRKFYQKLILEGEKE